MNTSTDSGPSPARSSALMQLLEQLGVAVDLREVSEREPRGSELEYVGGRRMHRTPTR